MKFYRYNRLITAFAVVFTLFSVASAATYEVPGTNIILDYEIEGSPGSETVTILDCNTDAAGPLVIPASINGHPVNSISNDAFEACKSLTSVVIPDSVSSIGILAFQFCSSLESVNIPDGVTNIGPQLFNECSSLTSVTIGNGVTIIEYAAFAACSSLESLTLPDGVTYIDNYSFERCYSLKNVNIPSNVTSIGDHAFQDCASLTSINLPDGLISIGEEAFAQTSLESLTIPASVNRIDERAFADCYKLTSAIFEGNSPYLGYDSYTLSYNVFDAAGEDVPEDFTIYFYEGNFGYTTPTWRSYPCVMLPAPSVNPLPVALRDAEGFGSGYYLSDWFGGFFISDNNSTNTLLFNMDFGWTWVSPDGTPDGMWWWSFNMGTWLWGSANTDRFFYRSSDGVWIYVVSYEGGGSSIQNTFTGEWSFLAQ